MKTHAVILVAAFASFSAASALAAVPISWNHQRATINQNWLDEYYSCDSASLIARQELETFGARNIQIDCDGGLPDGVYVTITTEFDSAVPAGGGGETGDYQKVKISGREECGIHEAVFEQVLPHFTTRNFQSTGPCLNPNDSFDFETEVLK
jgi:hypothetical protein